MNNRALNKVWYWGAICLLNVGVAAVFYSVNLKPSQAYAETSIDILSLKINNVAAIQGIPVRLVIPSLAIDLSVVTGSYSASRGNWTISKDNAYYADASMPLNNSNGTTLIYGHAMSSAFLSLPQIKQGAEVIVYTDNNYIFKYIYKSFSQIDPADVSVFNSQGQPKLVLQTCVGSYFEYRAMFDFKLISIDKLP